MKPIEFNEKNCVFAENQPEYIPLPVHKTDDGIVISCWKLTLKERLKILFCGNLWLSVMTFNHPLQPLYLSVDSPFLKKD
jgi:hypothetical protein